MSPFKKLRKMAQSQLASELGLPALESELGELRNEVRRNRLMMQAMHSYVAQDLAERLHQVYRQSPERISRGLPDALAHRFQIADQSDRPDLEPLEFAVRHALQILPNNAIYSFVPKNACSSMRFSIAMNNGFIKNESQVDWIHDNNLALAVKSIETLLNPPYAFVILRCPFERLVSVFLDKFLKKERQATNFWSAYISEIDYNDITFERFIETLAELSENRASLDEHWRHQVDFLLYDKYDRYFRMGDLGEVPRILKREIGFEFKDARSVVGHHTSHVRKRTDIKDPWSLSVQELISMSASGLPVGKSMFNKELVYMVRAVYKEDVDFYQTKFGEEGLLF
jgi:hypothetical protein